MSLKVSDIINFIEKSAPPYLAEEWDNVGLLLGNVNNEVKKVLVCLDVTRAVVNEAIKLKVNMIISHHPLIFKGIKSIDENSLKGSIIYSLIRNDISVYSAHTNLDVASDGVNEELGKRIGLKNLKNLKDSKVDKITGKVYGMGNYGDLEKQLCLKDFITHVKNKLSVGNIRLIGNVDRDIKTVAVFCGSFDEDYVSILRSKADILITGEIKYHTASDMNELGFCVVEAGHFYTERIIVSSLVIRLNEAFPKIEFLGSNMEEDPFKFT